MKMCESNQDRGATAPIPAKLLLELLAAAAFCLQRNFRWSFLCSILCYRCGPARDSH